jgi:serine/threonine protein kinase/Flp pilus assembly protein TadD
MINTTITHYKITGKLGQGGMGDVYRATDTQLDREVAIKVLPTSFANDSDRLARFEREAKVLAALNHPNIAAIYGIEKSGGAHALIMELVEGLTLAERLEQGPLELAEALETGRQIAEALEAAHDKGIIHRDLKPDNVKIDPQGRVKVLDFGLAKTLPPTATLLEDAANPADAPTLTGDYTEPGKVMGTASYMSPEQSRGLEVDRRTDVWAFGCCLFEVLTGQRPFKGQTPPDLVAEILKSDPDLTIIPPETPSEVLTMLRRCLDKNPRRRLRDLGDIAITLEDVKESSRIHVAVAPTKPTRGTRAKTKVSWGWQGAAVLGIIATGILGLMKVMELEPPSQIRSLAVQPFQNLKAEDTDSQFLATTLQQALKEQLGNLDQLDIKAEGSADVDATVQGTFVRVDESYHVTVAMIDEASQSETSLGSYSSPVNNIFPLQDEIATAVAERVRSDLTNQERRQIAAESNIDPRAYIAFRRGLEFYDQFTADGFTQAEAKFEQARQLDPDYVDPVAFSGHIKWVPTILGITRVPPKEGFLAAKAMLAEATRLDPTHSQVLMLRGWIAMIGDWNWEEARNAFRQAVSADPENAECHSSLAWYSGIIEGQYSDAIETSERAIDLDPKRMDYQRVKAWGLERNGDSAEALAILMELHERNASEWIRLRAAARCLLALDRLVEARERALEAVALSDGNAAALAILANIHTASGDIEAAEAIRDELVERSGRSYVPGICLAQVHAYLGDWDSAFDALQTAFDEQEGGDFIFSIRIPLVLKVFADQPRYWELIDRLKLPGLPVEHPYHEKELQMRFGKGSVTRSLSPGTIRTLAVQPFENAKAGDSESQWLSKTLHEALKHQLKPLNRLEIKPAGFAGVDATVQGTFVREGDQLHVTVSLVNHALKTEEVLGSYTKPAIDIFQLQNEIAIAVAEEIRSNLSEEERAQIAKKNDINPEAYIAYRRGYELYWTTNFEEAVTEFTRAIELAPDFVDPMVLLADAQWWPLGFQKTVVTQRERFDRAESQLTEAIRLAPDHSGVLWQRGWIAMNRDWDWKGAQRYFRKSMEDDPENADFHEGYILYKLDIESNFEDARDLVSNGLRLDPENAAIRNAEALVSLRSGNYEKALALWGHDSALSLENLDRLRNITICLIGLGQLSEAREKIERASVISDDHPDTQLLLAEILARSDDSASARSILESIEDERKMMYVSPMAIATVYAALGDWDSTFRLLEEGYASRDGWRFTLLRTHHRLTLMGDQPRYWDLVDRMKFPALPVQHPFYEKEQAIRFGRGASSVSISAAESKQRIRKLAVLPFTSIASEENQAWFADAVTQTLRTQLGKIQALSVIAHTSASQFKDSDDSVPEIARQLKVDALIEGSVIRVGDQVQITANLVNGSSGETQWGDIFVDSVDDLLSLQGKVAGEIAKSVKITMTPENTALLTEGDRVSRKAFEYYLQGVAQKGYSEDDENATLRFAEQAIEEDPNFASAHILKAQTLMQLLYWGYARGDEPIKQLKASLDRAMALNPRLPEAQSVAGSIALFIDRDIDSAEQHLAQAVQDGSNDADTHKAYAELLGILRRHPESITHARRAQELDPLNARVGHAVAWAHFRSGDYSSALEASEEVIKLDQDSFAGYHNKAFTLIGMGQDTEAEKNLRLAYEKSGQAPFYLARLGYGLGVLGKKEEAAKLLKQLEGIAQVESEEVKAHHFGLLYLGLGEDAKAIEWFERALDEGDMALNYLGSNFYWDADRKPLRENPTYQPLLRRIGLPE